MTYGRILLQFVVIPIVALAGLLIWEFARNRDGKVAQRRWAAAITLLILIVVATFYTIPWDNHLIATGVWWYSASRISGISFGSIPLEELLFFPLQTLLVGLWFMWIAPRVALPARSMDGHAGGDSLHIPGRAIATLLGVGLWLAGFSMLRVGWRPGTYLGWELVWALPPLLLQLLVGGDILWRQWRMVVAVIAPITLYLCGVDALAIHETIWTISPYQSLDLLLGGLLPLEELVFFLVTSALVTFGLTLGVAVESQRRVRTLYGGIAPRRASGRFHASS